MSSIATRFFFFFFFFNDTATTEIYTLSLHDALPICPDEVLAGEVEVPLGLLDVVVGAAARGVEVGQDRKSTRLNSSHITISYAVFCLKKKKKNTKKVKIYSINSANLSSVYPTRT